VASQSGHHTFPKLLPEVTVPVTRLPIDKINRSHVQPLFIAWLEAGLRCPVEGCEPWAALDEGNKGALPQPQAMLTRDRQFMTRKAGDRTKLDPLHVCAPRGQRQREHLGEGLEGVLEHWAHFHMAAGRCLSIPCCSSVPVEKLRSRCQQAVFPSLTSAAAHLVECRKQEVEARRDEYAEKKEQAAKSGKKRRDSPEDLVDIRHLPSVAQQMVFDFMSRYAVKVGLPRVVGRRKWVTDANLGRVIIGFHMRKIDIKKQG